MFKNGGVVGFKIRDKKKKKNLLYIEKKKPAHAGYTKTTKDKEWKGRTFLGVRSTI